MTLANLKKICAAYHKVATSALTVDSVDLFLVAANNVRSNAELLHNFELSRVQATLSIDGTTGGALSDAVFALKQQVVVSGTTVPDITGTYRYGGMYGNFPMYVHSSNISLGIMIVQSTGTQWFIVRAADEDLQWSGPVSSSPNGTYTTTGTGTGSPVVTLSGAFASIKEVIAVQRTNTDGILVPLDFTRADIPIERDRYELEMSEDYEAYRRYPSDAALLQRDSNGTIIQRGRKLFVYPVDAISSTPLSVTLEAYGRLADYTVANLSDTEPTDFFVEFGATYMQWAIITELNYLFKTFSPRTEGNLSPPEQAREQAWRNLLLWDTYLVDANATRSR
jgi:hypothetical protein